MIKENEISIAVIGLGYVGLPLAVEFSKKYTVVGYDSNIDRINELKSEKDKTGEVSQRQLKSAKNLSFFSEHHCLKSSNIYIITVPTPVDKNNNPNLEHLINASELVGKYIKKRDIVIYESTVYPGATEEICIPVVEKISSLKYNKDFFCGYSPERINPGDKEHSLTTIKKVTSGSDLKTAQFVSKLYESIIKAGVFQATSISVAEAAKVIENTQRDVNIALMNELALIFNKLNIDTNEVLKAAGTKWNFLPFKPGLVGGHCIGVDPYYLTHKAVEIGYKPEIILAGRRINDSMGKYIAEQTILTLIKNNVNPTKARVSVLGLTFKENCPDLRNTKVIEIINHLKKYNCDISILDEFADKKDAKKIYNINLVSLDKIKDMDSIIIAVGHKNYANLKIRDFKRILRLKASIIDVKSLYERNFFSETSFTHWRL